jgi:hypothetical protein
MPSVAPEITSGELYIALDGASYTWSDTRNASTATTAYVYQNGVLINAEYTGLRGNTFRIRRGYLHFDLSSVSGTITDLDLDLYTKSPSVTKDIIIVKSTAPDGSNIAVGDFGAADLSTAYSAEFTSFSSTGDAQNTIALNSTAISDANTNSELILAVVDHTYDYSNSQPSGLGLVLQYHLNHLTLKPTLTYTAVTGYGNTVMGVVSANIGEVTGVATANIGKVIGVQ